ncbi:hypothetical protein HDU96_005023 [Phlyctochytrium bullatum]|nr:hypothetical protein HDU96_005023 [Phlyctochytrium bullatum]
MEELTARLWRQKAFLKFEVDEPSVTVTSPLKGRVLMELTDSFEIPSGLKVILSGVWTVIYTDPYGVEGTRSSTRSSQDCSRNSRDRSSSENPRNRMMKKEFWNTSVNVANNGIYDKGTYAFPFLIPIPSDKLPAPFTHTVPGSVSCSVRYAMHALIPTGTFSFNVKSSEMEFTPIAPAIDIRSLPPLESSRSMSFLFGGVGDSATVTLRSPRSTYTSGDDTGLFLLFARNDSGRNMNELQFRLVQKVVVEKNSYRRIIYKINFPGVAPREAGHKVVKVEIPQCTPTTTNLGDALQVSYEVELVGIMGLSISSVVASAPIVIVSPGRGILVPKRVEKEEAELEASLQTSESAGRLASLSTVNIMADGTLSTGSTDEESPAAAIVADGLIAGSGAMLPETGARELRPGIPQSGTVGFQLCNLFYYDLVADVAMAGLDGESEADDGASSISGEIEAMTSGGIGIPTVIVEANSAVGLRISKDKSPSWWTYDLREELRSDEADGSQEHIARLSRGPGRYFIAVYGNSLVEATGVRYRIKLTTEPLEQLVPPAPGSTAEGQARLNAMSKATASYWCRAVRGEIPAEALVAGKDLDGTPLYVARARVGTGLHVGKIGRGFRTACVPYGGKERQVDGEYEVLCAFPGARWVKLEGRRAPFPENAVPAGHEDDGRPFFVGRAVVNHAFRSTLCPGKASPHVGGVNLPFDGVEVNVSSNFEVLVFDEKEYAAYEMTSGQPMLLRDELEEYHRTFGGEPPAWTK